MTTTATPDTGTIVYTRGAWRVVRYPDTYMVERYQWDLPGKPIVVRCQLERPARRLARRAARDEVRGRRWVTRRTV